MAADQEVFPRPESVRRMLPPGREAYRTVRRALEGNHPNITPAAAIWDVADAISVNNLQPPLPDDLKEAVIAASHFIVADRHSSPKDEDLLPGYNHRSARLIVEAVFEYGYRSDG